MDTRYLFLERPHDAIWLVLFFHPVLPFLPVLVRRIFASKNASSRTLSIPWYGMSILVFFLYIFFTFLSGIFAFRYFLLNFVFFFGIWYSFILKSAASSFEKEIKNIDPEFTVLIFYVIPMAAFFLLNYLYYVDFSKPNKLVDVLSDLRFGFIFLVCVVITTITTLRMRNIIFDKLMTLHQNEAIPNEP